MNGNSPGRIPGVPFGRDGVQKAVECLAAG